MQIQASPLSHFYGTRQIIVFTFVVLPIFVDVEFGRKHTAFFTTSNTDLLPKIVPITSPSPEYLLATVISRDLY